MAPASMPRSPAGTPPTESPSASSAKKSSWISGITSKFSTAQSPGASNNITSARSKTSPEREMPPPPQRRASLTEATPLPKDESTPYIPAAPKTSHPSFFQNALRKLSTSSGQLPTMMRSGGSGGLCERRVMNKDPHRVRSRLGQVDEHKLRRVAFCVDVEVAGGPRASGDERIGDPDKKKRAKKIKEQGEGQALKNPQKAEEELKQDGMVRIGDNTVEKVDAADEPIQPLNEVIPTEATNQATNDPPNETKPNEEVNKKKEKKKRSEEERKERKERKRQLAIANGSVPLETVRNDDSSPGTSPQEAAGPRPQVQPTTDPVRIYRRCCQLRETPVLRKITEQLAVQAALPDITPGVVCTLDLSGYWMHLADITTLGDWLAVVPVLKLNVDNCGLGDEGIRIILAGLLAAKWPGSSHCHHVATMTAPHTTNDSAVSPRPTGVIEKLSLKSNANIGIEGWKYICLFLHLSTSIKGIDVSGVPLPSIPPMSNGSAPSTNKKAKPPAVDISSLLGQALSTRVAGPHLDELVLSECRMQADQIANILHGATRCQLKRIGFAGNNLTEAGLRHVTRYLQEGICEGLDLGGNVLTDLIHVIAEAIDDTNPLYALSLADCRLNPACLAKLFPALVALPNFRFIDLSHNHDLFNATPNALCLLRKYLPKMQSLKRIHLADVDLTTDYAIAIAEILPENRTLAHINLLDNPKLSALAHPTNEASQEEACALYASLMAAARVSEALISVDIEVPGHEANEIVQALAKQIMAYCLRNLEAGPIADIATAADLTIDGREGAKAVVVPDVLLHLVGHVDGAVGDVPEDEPAPNDDYVISGTAVAKALHICLAGKDVDGQTVSIDGSGVGSGQATPRAVYRGDAVAGGKAKDMSKNLLGSARKIRARLKTALVRERRSGNDETYRRLAYLDQSLENTILRFEAEYPECRLPPDEPQPTAVEEEQEPSSSYESTSAISSSTAPTSIIPASEDSDDSGAVKLRRNASDASLAARAQLHEEGHIHRVGQHIRRGILGPQSTDQHGTTGNEQEAQYLQVLRERLETVGGDKLREMALSGGGIDAFLELLGTNIQELQNCARDDPEGFEQFRIAQELAQKNALESSHRDRSNVAAQCSILYHALGSQASWTTGDDLAMVPHVLHTLTWLTVLAVTQVQAACGDKLPNGVTAGGSSTKHEILSSGGKRSYLLHVPSNYDTHKPTPLVLSYHGHTKNCSEQEGLSQFSNEEYKLDAIAVYPQGLKDSWQGAPYATKGVDDVVFTLDLISTIAKDFCLDTKRIFASGKSNGGGFVNTLACNANSSSVIAAFAPVSGAYYENKAGVFLAGACAPRRTPMPILEFHGSADEVVPYNGGPSHKASLPAIPRWLQRWAARDGCAENMVGSSVMSFDGVVNTTTWSCGGHADIVTGYWIKDLGHDWPSTTPNDDNKHNHTVLNATPIIMDFFKRHSLPA
ncbi:MAG: hypothetical protein M1838_003827 [Thelocarpon superellum]|nr:MAG: hypothetical protein M1838_003827 [Thelocarpon superellum]